MKKFYFYFLISISIALYACSSPKQESTSADNNNREIHMTGAYTNHRELSKEEKTLFNQTYKSEPELTPIKVATQVVAGTNYSFTCKDKDGNQYEVVIFEALPCYGGKAEVTSVRKL